ncbi:MAG: hypothetical protein U0230_23315 [Polyangiales bacterium]
MSSRFARPSARLALFALLLSACDCGSSPTPSGGGGSSGTSTDASIGTLDGGDAASNGSGAVVPMGDGGTRTEYCEGSGPPVLVEGDGRTLCTGQLAGTVFRRAICTCGPFSANGGLRTRSFDSAVGMSMDLAGGASVGVNGLFNPNGAVDLGGSLEIGGSQAVLNGDTSVHGKLAVDGEISFAGKALVVDGDVVANGKVQGGSLSTTGALHVPPGAVVSAAGAPTPVYDATPVADPCECGASTFLDVAALVRTYAEHNDDASVTGWNPGVATNFSDGDSLDVPCGRFHLEGLAGTGAFTIRVHGRAALFVEGSVNVGSLSVVLDPGAELDLFVEGSVTAISTLMLGSSDAPRKVRLYVGGTTLNLQGASVAAGNVYAPHANLTTGGSGLVLHGSLFVGSVNPNGDLEIHYDRGVTASASECEPPQGCTSCLDCGGQACHAGACGSCATDADCCSPYVCRQGSCTLGVAIE